MSGSLERTQAVRVKRSKISLCHGKINAFRFATGASAKYTVRVYISGQASHDDHNFFEVEAGDDPEYPDQYGSHINV